jgi:hypothetical protein
MTQAFAGPKFALDTPDEAASVTLDLAIEGMIDIAMKRWRPSSRGGKAA